MENGNKNERNSNDSRDGAASERVQGNFQMIERMGVSFYEIL